MAAGARFLVSPGWTDVLLDAMKASGVPFLPGVSTTSEVVALLERGVREMKFFPAQAAGGTAYLKSLAGPLPQARFCPTGGIGPASAPEYLALPNVGCVGGSWMLPDGRDRGPGLGADRDPGAGGGGAAHTDARPSGQRPPSRSPLSAGATCR